VQFKGLKKLVGPSGRFSNLSPEHPHGLAGSDGGLRLSSFKLSGPRVMPGCKSRHGPHTNHINSSSMSRLVIVGYPLHTRLPTRLCSIQDCTFFQDQSLLRSVRCLRSCIKPDPHFMRLLRGSFSRKSSELAIKVNLRCFLGDPRRTRVLLQLQNPLQLTWCRKRDKNFAD
jgi:hypothetical protein